MYTISSHLHIFAMTLSSRCVLSIVPSPRRFIIFIRRDQILISLLTDGGKVGLTHDSDKRLDLFFLILPVALVRKEPKSNTFFLLCLSGQRHLPLSLPNRLHRYRLCPAVRRLILVWTWQKCEMLHTKVYRPDLHFLKHVCVAVILTALWVHVWSAETGWEMSYCDTIFYILFTRNSW